MSKTSRVEEFSNDLLVAIMAQDSLQLAILSRTIALNTQHKYGVVGFITPLMLAATFGRTQSIETLVDLDVDVNITVGGWSALTYAVSGKQKETVGILLDHGADINIKFGLENGVCLLDIAIKEHDELLALYLLERGLDPNTSIFGLVGAIEIAEGKGLAILAKKLKEYLE